MQILLQIYRPHHCGLFNLKNFKIFDIINYKVRKEVERKVSMSRWNTIDKWVITDVKTDEPIILYDGTFIEVTDFLNKFYKDGRVDVETYKNWLNRR